MECVSPPLEWSREEKQREKPAKEAVFYDTNQTAIYMANKSSKHCLRQPRN